MIKTRLPLLLVAVFGMAAAPLAAQSIDVSAANQRVRHAAGINPASLYLKFQAAA